jgi:hypothetical protein
MNNLPKVIIPSYKRSSLISELTLAFLHRESYPVSKIFIFVASEEERKEYAKTVSRHLYSQIIIGVLGLHQQRNFISDYFPEGEILIQLDDDVQGIKFLNKDLRFLDLVLKGCAYLQEGGLFGIMPNDNKLCFSEKTTTHLTHIIGSFFMIKNHKDLLIHTTEKEDFERCILYFKKYAAVARYKGAGVITKYAITAGGLQEEGRADRMIRGMQYMLETYPGFCKRVLKRKGEDIILNWRIICIKAS